MQQQWIFLMTSLWKIMTLTYILVLFFILNYLILITNIRNIVNLTFTRYTPTTLPIWFVLGSSTLHGNNRECS
jgi:hypothetical protein